jgi:hypothetical protein
MKSNIYIRLIKCAALVCLLGFNGCASAAPMVTLNAVGPKPPDVRPAGPMLGYLKVYSATTEYNDGDLMYYPHSRYSIYTGSTRYKWVDNHETESDESPQVVALPVGTYYVLAQSELDGLVRVPVIIKGGQTTVVNLERGRTSDGDTQGVQSSRGVVLPSGQVAGWRASS